jgi:hypothetical protein
MDTAKPLARLRAQLVQDDSVVEEGDDAALDALLIGALVEAAAAAPELMTVSSPVSRPQRLKLSVLVSDEGLDSMYGKERAELAVSHDGVCYLIYRRSDGGDYAVVWSPSTLMAPTTMSKLPDVLVVAMLGGSA